MNATDKMVDYTFQMTRFRKYIRALRLTLGCSGREFANLMEIGRATYQGYEKNPASIPLMFYLSFRCIYLDYAARITHTEFYENLWFALIEGLDEDGHTFSEENADYLAAEILRIVNDQKKCPRKYGSEYIGRTVRA